ncbi:MAG: hypothetical protein EA344_11650, partial [Alkalicoccus sp.]
MKTALWKEAASSLITTAAGEVSLRKAFLQSKTIFSMLKVFFNTLKASALNIKGRRLYLPIFIG